MCDLVSLKRGGIWYDDYDDDHDDDDDDSVRSDD